MPNAVIVEAVRSPIGKRGDVLRWRRRDGHHHRALLSRIARRFRHPIAYW